MKEYQVSFGKYVSKAELPALLKQLGYQGGAGGEGIILESITTWYLKTGLSSNVTRETDPTEWKDYFTPPDPSSSGRYVWRYMDYWYTTNHHTPDFHVYTDCELVTMYSSGGGMGVEFAYALFNKDVPGVTVLNEGEGDVPDTSPSATWTKDLDTLIYNANQYLWMSQRIIDGETVGPWQKPIRISGKDGDPGADGLDTEFIYKLMGRKPNNNEPAPVTENPLVNRNKDDYYPESDGWSDSPQGVEDDGLHNFEWMSYRTLLTENDPDYGTYKWSEFSTPIIWSAYGEKGMDGDGIEYVYRHVLDITNFEAPASPKFYTTEGDTVTWYEGVVLKDPGNPNNSNDWLPKDYNSSSGAFEYWIGGKYGPQGEWIPKIDPDGGNEDSNFWSDDPEGVGYFIRYQQNGQPVLDEDNNPVQDLYKYEYVTSRKRVNGEWGEFSEPKIWSTFSKEHTVEINDDGYWVIDGNPTGVKAEGENGKGVDLKGKVDYYDADHRNQLISEGYEEDPNHVYTFLSDVEDTYNPEVGDCWVVTLNGHIYLYVGGDDADWTEHWQDFGEFQGEGAYVHIAWSTRVWTDNNGILHADNFTVDRPGNSTVEYAWMGICTNNDENDPGESNLTKYKWNYVHGRDGDTYERVYIRTERNVTPIIKKTQEDEYPTYNDLEGPHPYSKDEYLPFVDNYEDIVDPNDPETVITLGCYPEDSGNSENHVYQFSDDPKGVNSVYRYEWRAERKKVDGVWQNFGRVILESNYSNNGQGVIRSTVFKRSITQPIIPSGGDFISPKPSDSDWKDGLPTGTVGSIWMSSAIFTSDRLPPQSGWSVPILLQDSDTLDIELSTNSRNNPPAAPVKYEEATVQNPCNSHVPEEGEDGYDPNKPSEAIGDQIWYDPEKDADYINSNASNFNWMATRTNYINPSTGNHDWRDWIIILIKGEAGEAGKEFQHAYLAYPTALGQPRLVSSSTSYNTPPTTSATQGYNGGNAWSWTLNTTANIVVGPDDSLWMTERWLQPGTNEVGTWDNPIRISGTGTPGEDAEDIQFIYKQSTDLPNDPTNTDIPSMPKAVKENVNPIFWEGNVELIEGEWIPINWDTTVNGEWSDWQWDSSVGEYNEEGEWIPIGWTDSPTGVDEINKYEWMCQRIKPRTNDPDHTDWGPWSKVFVWSAYGDTGMDGDGIEYIFTRDSITASSSPASPIAETDSHPNDGIIWRGGVEKNSSNRWIPKDLPSSEGNFRRWIGGEYNPHGEWIPGGSYDQNNFVEGNWTDEPQGVGEFIEEDPNNSNETIKVTYRNEWVSTRKRINGEWKEFSVPTIWSNYLVLSDIHIGQDGQWYIGDDPTGHYAEGKDGKGIQIKGTVDFLTRAEKNTYETNHSGETVTCLQDIYPHDDLYQDLDIGDCYVVLSSRYLYACKSNKISWVSAHQNSDTWEVSGQGYDDNWDSIGEFLGKGSHMHIAWAATKDPDTRIKGNNINFDSDGNITLIKKFLIDYAEKIDGVDYDWMGVCTNYDEDDPASDYDLDRDSASTTSWNGNWNLYKWNNVRGRDGDNYERVYIKSKEESPKPELNQNSYSGNTGHDKQNEDEFLPQVSNYNSSLVGNNNPYSNSIFTDDPTGVTSVYKYEWMAERKKKYNSTTKVVEWGEFSPPALWARYSEDGHHGNSVQVAYAIGGSTLTITDKTGNLPISSGTTWYSTTTGLVPGDNQYLWMSQRVGVTGSWGLWEDPIRLSGQDGRPGEDGADIEFIYLRSNDSSAPSSPANPTAKKGNKTVPYYGDVEKINNVWTPTSWDITNNGQWSNEWSWINGLWNNDGEWIPTGWSDNPSGVDSTHKYEWACQRTKSSGNNQSWTQWVGPFKWSAYGDTGMDGDGVEYVFFRSSVAPNTPIGPRAQKQSNNSEKISYYGGVKNTGTSQNPVWVPKDWSSYSSEDWSDWEWDSTAGYYNSPQGEWVPRAYGTDIANNATWSDDPLGVTMAEGERKEWVSTRKRVNGTWDDFDSPKLWASFGTDIYIDDTTGCWVINGHNTGIRAEGEDGKGVALKGSVHVLSNSEKSDYASANNMLVANVVSLQDVRPNNGNTYSNIAIGDCYVVKKNRYLYTCIHNKDPKSESNPDGWDYTNSTSSNWIYTTNWGEIGEFQGADGDDGVSQIVHIAWTTSDNIIWDSENPNEIADMTNNIILAYEDKEVGIEYDWMGICKNEDINDPEDWQEYKWNHVRGKDGSDYEKVYVRTNSESVIPEVNQNTGYSPDHDVKTDPEFWPAVSNYTNNSSSISSQYFTDDPHGVSAQWPYEWVAERRKALNSSTQQMEWQNFGPPRLWATYSFDGMSVYLTRGSDSVTVDAAGNVVGGYGSASSPRIYTEVKIYDPKKNNGDGTYGGYLTYNSSTTVAAGNFKLSAVGTNCTKNITSTGKVWVNPITDVTKDTCSIAITATISSGKTFNFNFPVTLNHIPQTYLTYTLTNDSDTFTYRTRTQQYDGLPIETRLEVQTTDGTVDSLGDNTLKENGYIKSVTVVGKGETNFLRYARVDGTNVGNDKTITVEADISDTTTISHTTKTVTIYKNSTRTQDTGLRLEIKSDGNIKLYRRIGTADLDLEDTKHDLDISCIAVLGDVEYNSPAKTFGLSEKNDVTLYKLVLSSDTFIKDETGNYSPSTDTFSVKVNVNDGQGTTTVTPVSSNDWLVRENVKVRFINGNPATTPGSDTLDSLSNLNHFQNINNNFFTVVVVEYDSSNQPILYHDAETVDIVPPGISQTYLDLSPTQFIVDCNEDGEILSTANKSLTVTAHLKWGNQTCGTITAKSMNVSGFTTGTSGACTLGTINDNNGEITRTFTFKQGEVLTSGIINVSLTGTFSDGVSRTANGTVIVQANLQGETGPTGPKGDFKSTAFIRTYTDISAWLPTGGNYNSPIPTDFNGKTRPDGGWGWEDGIPAGEETLWSSTATFYGNNAQHTWSYPKIVQDSDIYDVEFALKQSNGSIPNSPVKYDEATTTNKCNSHKPLPYDNTIVTSQIWYDPVEDKDYVTNNYDKFYWKAERNIINNVKGPWVITQIKGESEPNIKCDTPIVVIETDPTGKLSSSKTFKFKTWLRLGESIQIPTSQASSNYNDSVIDTIDDTFQSSDNSVEWEVALIPNIILPNTGITITMSNASCSASKTIQIVFERKNQSQVKSFIFQRFASQADANSGKLGDIGSFSEPGPGTVSGSTTNWGGWSDGLPSSGTNPIYMSSRLFTSDGLSPQQGSWSTPVMMSDTNIFDIEFSLSIGKPNDPPENINQRNDAGWYDPNRSPARDDWDQMRWMATRTKTGNSWGNWAINKIKGETGDTGTGISSITPWYKAFDTLDVVIPSAGNETDGWAEDDDLIGAGWTDSYIKPTKENPYLWKFIRTIYENPPSVVHNGLEMIQVWAENMINPNLLDDTDFSGFTFTAGTDTSMGAWDNAWKMVNVHYGQNAGINIIPNSIPLFRNHNYFGGIYDYGTATTSYIVVLKQFIFKVDENLYKVSPGNWYTLSFWMRGNANTSFENAPLELKFLSRNSSNGNSTDLIDTSAGIYLNDIYNSTGITIIKYVHEHIKNNSGITYNDVFNNVWKLFTVTFKIKDTIPDDIKTCHIEWYLNVPNNTNNTNEGGGIYICMPKLEIGKVATDYISSSAIRDPYPRLTVWAEGKQYYQGKYGEPYLDAVTYGTNWFRCRNTHISSNSNKPVIGQTTEYWEPAQNLDFVVTDLLLAETAFIKDLAVGGLRTDDMGKPHVEMIGPNINFYGRADFPNIKMNVDEDNMAYLEFYDKNNTFLYDLGPSGIRWKVTVTSASCIQNTLLVKTTTTDSNNLPQPDFMSGGTIDTSLWKFSPAREDGVIVGDPNYTKNDDSIANRANGKYFTSTTFVKQVNGSWVLDESKYANYMYRRQDEPVDTLSTNLGNYSASTINNTIQNWKDDLVMLWNFPSGSIDEINDAYTVNNNIATIRYPIYRQVYINIVNGFSKTFYAFKQQNTIWMVLA